MIQLVGLLLGRIITFSVLGCLRARGAGSDTWHRGMNWSLKDGAVAEDGGDFNRPFQDVSLGDDTVPIQDGSAGNRSRPHHTRPRAEHRCSPPVDQKIVL